MYRTALIALIATALLCSVCPDRAHDIRTAKESALATASASSDSAPPSVTP